MVRGCIDLLEGRCEVDDVLVLALGGPAAGFVLRGREGGKDGYSPRVWAARGLLYAWKDCATTAIVRATTDDAWRVREMAATVIARQQLGDAFNAVTELRNDQVSRVRAGAERAVSILAASGT